MSLSIDEQRDILLAKLERLKQERDEIIESIQKTQMELSELKESEERKPYFSRVKEALLNTTNIRIAYIKDWDSKGLFTALYRGWYCENNTRVPLDVVILSGYYVLVRSWEFGFTIPSTGSITATEYKTGKKYIKLNLTKDREHLALLGTGQYIYLCDEAFTIRAQTDGDAYGRVEYFKVIGVMADNQSWDNLPCMDY